MSKAQSGYIFASIGVIAFIALAVVGQYVGGMAFASWQKIPKEAITLTSLFDYWDAYSNVKMVKLALIGGFVVSALVPVVPIAVVCFALFGQTQRALHGNARFANRLEIKKAGLLGNADSPWPGVVFGKYSGEFLTYCAQNFIALAAPTRSGKGVGIVIPNLLSYMHSVVVLDIKFENWIKTSGFRAQHGQACFLFCPGHPEMRSHRWNPLSYIRRDEVFRMGDIQDIASALYPSGGKHGFWNDNAQILFHGLVLYVLETPNEAVTMHNIVRLTSPATGEKLHKWIDLMVETRQSGASELPKLSCDCIQALRDFANNNDTVRADILSTFLAPLNIFRNPLVAAATSGDDFDLRDVRKKKMSIYIGMTPNDLVKFNLLINLFFTQLINENTRTLPENDASLAYQCLLLMDEFTALGRINIIQKAVAYMAGYNMRLVLIFQNKAQIAGREEGYGQEGASTLMTNCAMRILFQPKENEDAKEYSEILGYQTVKAKSRSRQLMGRSGNSESVSDQRRALMLPQEIKEIGFEKLIISMENCRPIFADKIIYWNDPAFAGRFDLPTPLVPALDITAIGNRPSILGEFADLHVDDICNQREILEAIGKSIGFDFFSDSELALAA